ncbi:MAG: single-stranded DNA-binding protein [Actinobacteria bacterium]|jgi:single-strand DNA-binding protein|nr:single-stranded DNA-binding protein [Actinomycetota bacterium]
MARGIAHVTLVGNLTRDPELRQTPNGTSVCQLGVAVNSSYKDASGQWVEKPNFFDVVVWGVQGENCARYLSKGRQVAVDGRLDQRSWETQDGGRRSKVEIVADTVMFIGSPSEAREPAARGGDRPTADAAGQDDFRDIDFGGDDIPF